MIFSKVSYICFDKYLGKVKDIFGKLYNGFLLRDLLGYVVPGGIVLICLTHMLSLFNGVSYSEMLRLIPGDGMASFFLISLCYACGHFLSGFFFHTRLFRWLFRYSPDLSKYYPNLPKNKAWAKHRYDYRRVCTVIGESFQSQIERHAALVHFTGHISASLIFTFIYLIFWSLYASSFKPLYYTIPIVIIFPGIFSHYRQITIERFELEILAIKSLAQNEK